MTEQQDTKIAKLHRWSATMFHMIAIGGVLFLIGLAVYESFTRTRWAPQPAPVSQAEVQEAIKKGISLQSIQVGDHSTPFPEEGLILYEIHQSEVSEFLLANAKRKSSNLVSDNYEGFSYKIINNLAIRHWKTGVTKLLLEKRALVESYFTWNVDDTFLVVASVRVPNREDETIVTDSHLLIYDVHKDKRHYVDLGDSRLTDFSLLRPCARQGEECTSPIPVALVVEVVLDRNGDGEFDHKTETIIPMKVNLETMKLVPLLDPAVLEKAQDILDGKTLVDSNVRGE